MTLARWQATITDEAGNVLPAASVTVRREVSGSPLASLFSDRAGVTPTGNPFTADGDGYAAFHVAGGAYRITATLGGVTREWRYVAVGLAAESDGKVSGVALRFSTTTTDADPGPGYVRLDNATPASVTSVYIDNTTEAGDSIAALLDTYDDLGNSGNRGTVTLQTADGSLQFIARVTGSVVDGTGYRKLTVTPLVTTALFTLDQEVFLTFLANGLDGAQPGTPFTFSTTTAMADPGAGTIRLNNATLSSVTAAAVDDTSAASGNPDVSNFVLSWDDSSQATNKGYLLIKKVSAPQNFAVYRISGATTDNSGWSQLALTYVTHAGSFANADLLSLEFSAAADAQTSFGKQTAWIPASAMSPRVTNGAGIATLDSGSNDITFQTLDFDQTTQEFAHFQIAFPKSWNEGTVTFQPFWTAVTGTAAQTAILTLAGVAISNDDLMNATFGTAQSSSDALIATTDLHVGPESAAITIGGSPAEDDLVCFQLARDVATDTLAADLRLIGIKLFYTTNANTDA